MISICVWSFTKPSDGLSRHKSEERQRDKDWDKGAVRPHLPWTWRRWFKINDHLHLQDDLGRELFLCFCNGWNDWEGGRQTDDRPWGTYMAGDVSEQRSEWEKQKWQVNSQKVTLDFSWQLLANTRWLVAGQKGAATMSNWCHDSPYCPSCSLQVHQRQIHREIMPLNCCKLILKLSSS